MLVDFKPSIPDNKTAACTHCGDFCHDQIVEFDNNSFCCQGCKMVYTILNENGLNNFYKINKDAGLSQKLLKNERYDYLDDPEVVNKLISFTEGSTTKIRLYLPQIHCSSCLWLLERLPVFNDNILQSRVDFLKREATVTFNNQGLSLKELVELLASIGYPPTIQLENLEQKEKPLVERSLYYKLGLSGFAFGNIMLFSFPEYLGMSHDSEFSNIFSYINLIIALPVFVYCGKDYFFSAWRGLKHGYLNIDVPVSLGISALFIQSIVDITILQSSGYLDSLVGLLFFLSIGKWFQERTFARMSFDRDYKSYFPIATTVWEDGKEMQRTLDKIEVGDQLIIRHGELFPVDAQLLDGLGLIDYSFVSGESTLVNKGVGDQLYAGGKQMGGRIKVLANKRVSNSYLTQLWNEQTFNKDVALSLSELSNKVARFFTIAILAIAFLTLFFWLPTDVGFAINAFTSVLIIACPCAVALSIPFTFGNAQGLLSKHNIFLKNTEVVEALTSIDTIVFDKTGTLTSMSDMGLKYTGRPLSAFEIHVFSSLADQSNHPLSKSIVQYWKVESAIPLESFHEILGEGVECIVENKRYAIGKFSFANRLPMDPSPTVKTDATYISVNGKIIGSFALKSSFRKGIETVINELSITKNVAVISGDNERDLKTVRSIIGWKAQVLFNQSPKDKLNFIRELQNHGEKVCMIGDGLNDAGALSQSDVGIVITEDTSNFTPACDIIFQSDNFHRLPKVFKYAVSAKKVVFLTYLIAIIYNVVGLSFAVQGLLSPVIAAILMPLSSISVVLLGVGMTTWLDKQQWAIHS